MITIPQLHRYGTQGPERGRNLPKMTQPGGGEAGLPSDFVALEMQCSLLQISVQHIARSHPMTVG